MPPPLLQLPTEADYRAYFLANYCNAPRFTHDGIPVHFLARHFGHAFFESANRKQGDKSLFSLARAERMDWIGAALQDPAADLYVGWNKAKTSHDPARRVALVFGSYVVVLEIVARRGLAYFTTAFIATPGTLAKIQSGPRWGGKWVP